MKNNIPFKAPKVSKHPVIEQYEELLKKYDKNNQERWDKSFLTFYEENINFINDIKHINSNNILSKIITIKIICSRIFDDKGEYKKTFLIAKELDYLISKLDINYSEYKKQYINAKKWIAISLGRNNKYKESNKIFKELISLDQNKEFYVKWIVENYKNIILSKIIIIITICAIINLGEIVLNIFTDSPNSYIPRTITLPATIILFLGVIIYFNIENIIKKIVSRNYKINK